MLLAFTVLLIQILIGAILIRNRIQFRGIITIDSHLDDTKRPLVSILIPARNEEKVISTVVTSALKQTYENIEVIVLNDRSEDGTRDILEALQANYPDRLKVFDGTERPGDWLGKPWACKQLAEHAKGDIFLFVDADTRLDSALVMALVADFKHKGAGLTTVWPQQVLGSLAEKVIIPLVYYTLLGFLVTEYTRRDPKWMPPVFALKFRNLFAAACGQCISMPKATYESVGGHYLVKTDVVEDVAFARAVRTLGLPVRMYHGLESIQCRMYTNHNEIFMGFRKNFLAGFGGNVFLFMGSALLHVVVFLLPIILFVISFIHQDWLLTGMWFLAILIPTIQRLLLNHWFKWPLWTAFTHLFGVLWFQMLGIVVIYDRIFKRKVLWKGRPLP